MLYNAETFYKWNGGGGQPYSLLCLSQHMTTPRKPREGQYGARKVF